MRNSAAVEAATGRAAPCGAIGAPGSGPFRYLMYGVPVESALPLPVTAAAPGDGVTPAWVFRRPVPGRAAPEPDGPVAAELRCHEPCHNGSVVTRLWRGPGGAWLWNQSIGTCHIAPNAQWVDIYPEAGVDERVLGLVLAGQVAIYVLHQLGYPTLHASAIVTGRGAVAFLGPKEQGKSTMAAGFLRRGATLLTDDALPLRLEGDGVCGAPGLPSMRIWRDTAEGALELSEELPDVMEGIPKKVLALDGRYPFAQTPARLRAVYVLDRYDPLAAGRADTTIRTLTPREGLKALLAQTAWSALLRPADMARLLPVYARLVAQAPARVLSFPHGFEHQAAVHARIMADLEAQ